MTDRRASLQQGCAARHVYTMATLVTVSMVGCAQDVPQDKSRGEHTPAASVSSLSTTPFVARDGSIKTVTLVTGDRVTVQWVAGHRLVDVVPGEGREHIAFDTHETSGELVVIPSDVGSLVNSGRLDARLFNITALLEFGYDDTSRDNLPLIVSYRPGSTAFALGSRLRGVAVSRELPFLRSVALSERKAESSAFWRAVQGEVAGPDIKTIWLDGMRKPSLDRSVLQVGAPAAWQQGYTGQGVTVAVLDSGIDATHPDLEHAVLEARNFTSESPADQIGHGTHVASTIAGSGAASNGQYKGVAPSAKLLDAKVCFVAGCPESAILAGMQWAAVEKHARIINLSLGGHNTPEIDPLEEAVDRLTAEYGTLFVVAAGNDGQVRSVGSPASADAALAVGAVDAFDELAPFSSRGPRVGDDGAKPDISAPGVGIVAARSRDASIGEPVGAKYLRLSGTSMATPHVAGAAAILASQHPEWRGPQIKSALTGSAKPNPKLSVFEQGSGRLDVARAVAQTLLAETTSVNFGIQRWPHDDDEPVVRTVSYRNTGTTPVTVNLSLQATGPDGRPAPQGMFAIHPASLTVPAQGEAQATVTADTRISGADGTYGGVLLAKADSLEVRTTLSVVRELESYEVTFEYVGRSGVQKVEYNSFLVGVDHDIAYCGASVRFSSGCLVYDASGRLRLRLAKGRYTFAAKIYETAADGHVDRSLLVQPLLSVTGEATVQLDARLAKPINVTVPHATARLANASVNHLRYIPGGWVLGGFSMRGTSDSLFTGQLGPAVPDEEFVGSIDQSWFEPNPAPPGEFRGAEFFNSPYSYQLAYAFHGSLPTGLEWNVQPSELATVHVRYDAPVAGKWGVLASFHYVDGAEGFGFNNGPSIVSLPMTRTEYFSTNGVQWTSALNQHTPFRTWPTAQDIESNQKSEASRYEAGRTYRDHRYGAVFGPGFVKRSPSLVRTRNGLYMGIDFFSDSTLGHGGRARVTSSRTSLFRDGQKVTESSENDVFVTMAPGPATFRLEREVEIDPSASPLSSKMMTAWTFHSEPVTGNPMPQPVSAVRFAPDLDSLGRAPANVPYFIPISVQKQPDSVAGDVSELAVDVSYDDGQRWEKATLLPKGDGWLGVVKHPRSASFVSLRAKAVDTKGNSVEQTVIRAYALKSL